MSKALKRILPVLLVTVLVLGCASPTTADNVEKNADGSLTVKYIDVGQGDSTLIQFPSGKNMLIDGGRNGQGKVVLKELEESNVNQIDILVATHPDADHIGGLAEVINGIPVKSVYAPKVSNNTKTFEDFLQAVKDNGLSIKTAKAGDDLPVGDGATAIMVGPVKEYAKSDTNSWSAVIRIAHGENAFLMTGDATTKAEKDMIRDGQPLSAKVLKVGHHGSNTSSSPDFLDEVKPSHAVISVGKNSYGHPSPEVLDALKNAGLTNETIYRTDELGTLTITSDAEKLKVSH